MPELWGRSSDGVNRKLRELRGLAGGANQKLKELWAVQSGVNRRIFRRGIEWTWAFTVSSHVSSYNNSAHSIYVVLEYDTDGYSSKDAITYTFSEPLVLKAGSTIATSGGGAVSKVAKELDINGSLIFAETSGSNYTYTVPSDISVSTIKFYITSTYSGGGSPYASGDITINPSGGTSFLLTGAGEADQ